MSHATWWVRSTLAALALGAGCVSPDAFFRDAGPPLGGEGGFTFGNGGQLGGGGTGEGGQAAGGRSGTGGVMTGGGGRNGAGGAIGTGGRSGTGGASTGVGGRNGTGGASSGVGGRNGTGGATGAGGSGTGGASGSAGAGGCAGVYCDNFESDTLLTVPATWTRLGGSSGDWEIASDAGGKVFAQDHASSATFRACYASGATGAPWSGATTLSAQVKVLASGTSGATTALVCLRYTTSNTGYCLALIPGMGAQIQARSAGTITEMGALAPITISLATAYNVQLSISAAGVISASVGGTTAGTLTPTTAIASGFAGIATQSAEAAFDNVVVAQP